MFALLASWEWQTQGDSAITLKQLNIDLPLIHRGVESAYAISMV
eukprot:CAMPEP_0173308224 /NCGR_PEP_ID=MMETSP1143-20121109/21619_1 /TAXON_ID=483371 /ORGANISM="non described non described, Strain CCMP2298" /LENGTH=43 /DNA_ID= /DNA_START= /DNA_END= /DNA_ORIENTATION=